MTSSPARRRPLRVLFPKNIDRVQSPMSALFLAIVRWNPDLEFFSFSSPETDEDRRLASEIWAQPNLHRMSPAGLLGRFDIAHHASAGRGNYLVCRGCRARGARHVFTANCQPYPTHPRLELLKRCVRKADHVVSVSRAVAEDFEREVGRASDAVIPNGFDAAFYAPDPAPAPGASPFALYASALIDRKRPEVLLQMARAMPDLRFVMVGAQADSALGRRIAAEAAGLPNVELRGAVPRAELRDLMRRATLFLHPSDYEGLPLSVIEALGTGLPVIAQPRSSLPELIVPGENGWLVPADDVPGWTARIREVLAWTPAERFAFAARARADAVARFSWESIGRAYGDFYRQVVEA